MIGLALNLWLGSCLDDCFCLMLAALGAGRLIGLLSRDRGVAWGSGLGLRVMRISLWRRFASLPNFAYSGADD